MHHSAACANTILFLFQSVIAITLGLLFPLSLIKDLSALAFTSILGFGAITYTVIFIIVRSLDGSYALPGGHFLQDPSTIAALPSFDRASIWNFDFTSLVLASNLGLACTSHELLSFFVYLYCVKADTENFVTLNRHRPL